MQRFVDDDEEAGQDDTAGDQKTKTGEEPPYSVRNEVCYFFRVGAPLGLSAALEWGFPPMFAMIMAGQTEHSEDLQASLGYGRMFYNCTTLMVMFGFIFGYFGNVIPGAVGAGRSSRIPFYFVRSVTWTLLFMFPFLALQFATYVDSLPVPLFYHHSDCVLSFASFNRLKTTPSPHSTGCCPSHIISLLLELPPYRVCVCVGLGVYVCVRVLQISYHASSRCARSDRFLRLPVLPHDDPLHCPFSARRAL